MNIDDKGRIKYDDSQVLIDFMKQLLNGHYNDIRLKKMSFEIEFENEINDSTQKTDNDAVAAKRREIAEALRTGEPLKTSSMGEVELKDDSIFDDLSKKTNNGDVLIVPDHGIL